MPWRVIFDNQEFVRMWTGELFTATVLRPERDDDQLKYWKLNADRFRLLFFHSDNRASQASKPISLVSIL